MPLEVGSRKLKCFTPGGLNFLVEVGGEVHQKGAVEVEPMGNSRALEAGRHGLEP